MVSEWMANGNIIEYIKHNDSQRMRLVRESSSDDIRELMNPAACRLREGGAVPSRRESRSRGPQRRTAISERSHCVTYLSHVDPQANILITSDNPVRACLADFGFMTIVYDDAGGPESTSALGGGTTPFMAPELLSPSMFGKNRCRVSKEADIYAFGMVILQVCLCLLRHLIAH